MRRRPGRGFFVVVAAVLVLLVVVGVIVTKMTSAPVTYPGWGDLPSPHAFENLNDLAPCALGTTVNVALVPVVAWSGATEEFCNPQGDDVVAFDGPGVPVFARQLTVTTTSDTVSGSISGRSVYGGWVPIGAHGWGAVVVWGAPTLPTGTPDMVLGLCHYWSTQLADTS